MTKESLRIYSQAMTEFELLFVSHDCSLVGFFNAVFFFLQGYDWLDSIA